MILVDIQTENFDVGDIYLQMLQRSQGRAGAIVTFTGNARDLILDERELSALSIEHYPSMTENALKQIAEQAVERFELVAVHVIHRIGVLETGEQIVHVCTAAEHRTAAFDAAEMIMDYLKNDAPFWKKEIWKDGTEDWVEQKESDRDALTRWNQSD